MNTVRMLRLAGLILALSLSGGAHAAYVPAGTAVAPTNFTPSDGCTLASEQINITTATSSIEVAAVANNYVKIYGLFFRVASTGANSLTIEDTAGTDLFGGQYDFTAKESLFLAMQPTPWSSTAIGTGLQLTTTTTVPVRGMLYYTQCTTAP